MNSPTNNFRYRSVLRRRVLPGTLLLSVIAVHVGTMPAQAGFNINPIKVWTFNLRFDNGVTCFEGCDNKWARPFGLTARRNLVFSYMNARNLDIFGLQEVRDPTAIIDIVYSQLLDVASRFPNYDYVAYGNGNEGDEAHEPIFWRNDRFTLQNSGNFWLSCTPDTEGSQPPGTTDNARIASWVILYDNYTLQSIFVINAHWSLNGAAREYGAALMRERIENLAGNRPVIVLGDFNALETSDEFEILTGAQTYGGLHCPPANVPAADMPLKDSYRAVNADSANELTFHNFNGGSAGDRIDFILHTDNHFEPTDAAIVRVGYQSSGACSASTCYPSDHYAVEAKFSVLLAHTWLELNSLTPAPFESGTQSFPFDTLAEGQDTVRRGGMLHIKTGATGDGFTFNKHMKIVAEGGDVQIGRL